MDNYSNNDCRSENVQKRNKDIDDFFLDNCEVKSIIVLLKKNERHSVLDPRNPLLLITARIIGKRVYNQEIQPTVT